MKILEKIVTKKLLIFAIIIAILFVSVTIYPEFVAVNFGYFLPLAVLALPIIFMPTKTSGVIYGGVSVLVVSTVLYANSLRQSWTELPLTFTDLYIFLLTPRESLHALFFEGAAQSVIFYSVFAIIAALSLYVVFMLSVRPARFLFVALYSLFVWFLVAPAGPYSLALRKLPAFEAVSETLWEPAGVRELADRMGIFNFLIYTASLDRGFIDRIISDGASSDSLRPSIFSHAQAGGFPEIPSRPSRQSGEQESDLARPNIVILLAESTFDPNDVFLLRDEFRGLLFQQNPETHVRGHVRVNAIGGGTWISEFEVLTGLDSRLFGFAGYHTHTAISPYISRTFVHYLTDRGYSAEAFYGTDGDFFDARNAFRRYGFQRFHEKADLGITAPGWRVRDTEIADAVIRTPLPDPRKPFFRFAVTVENHSPHPCENFPDAAHFVSHFRDDDDFSLNCTLNEYLHRLNSTNDAVNMILAYLRSIARQTGRPFVLMVVGDHQPHSITRTGQSRQDFRHVRRNLDPRRTALHIFSSVARSPIDLENGAFLPITLLPTILSSYVAENFDSLYLPGNYVAFRGCGPDFLRTRPVSGFWHVNGDYERAVGNRADDPMEVCPLLPDLLAHYRSSGLIIRRR
jgi:hypothetical protein